jgi:hypothetical protein
MGALLTKKEREYKIVDRVEKPLSPSFHAVDSPRQNLVTHLSSESIMYELLQLVSHQGTTAAGKTFYCRHYDLIDADRNIQCRYVCGWKSDVALLSNGQLNFATLDEAIDNLVSKK